MKTQMIFRRYELKYLMTRRYDRPHTGTSPTNAGIGKKTPEEFHFPIDRQVALWYIDENETFRFLVHPIVGSTAENDFPACRNQRDTASRLLC